MHSIHCVYLTINSHTSPANRQRIRSILFFGVDDDGAAAATADDDDRGFFSHFSEKSCH